MLLASTVSFVTGQTTSHTSVSVTTTIRGTRTLTSTRTVSTATSPSSSPTSPGDASWTSDSTFRSSCLNSTNSWREHHNATALSWNATLASVAQKWTAKCLWEHSGSGFGENLAIGYPDVSDSIDGWGYERSKYNFESPQFTEQTGHFSQLVWKGSKQVGCGRTFCGSASNTQKRAQKADSGWFLACEYYPPGNVAGEYEANVQSQLPEGDTSHGFIGDAPSDAGYIQSSTANTPLGESCWMVLGALLAVSVLLIR